MNAYDKLLHTIFRITVFTLALVIITVVAVMCKAIFDPNVDNKEIFGMLSPAFNTVIGAFVGLLGGISLTRPTKDEIFPVAPTTEDAQPTSILEEVTDVVEATKDAIVEEATQIVPEEIVEVAKKVSSRKKSSI